MIIFVILQRVPPILALTLAGMLYLTWLELRDDPLSGRAKLWWYLFVGLFNIVGYAVMRAAIATWRRRYRQP